MSLSNEQKSLLKRGQREAGIGDEEYRGHLRSVAGVESSTAPEITDRHMDKLLCLFEAIFWRGVDAGALQGPLKPNAVFRKRGYWASRNRAESTSRDRFVSGNLVEEIQGLEEQALSVGLTGRYCEVILDKVTHGRRDARSLYNYRAALQRSIKARRKKLDAA